MSIQINGIEKSESNQLTRARFFQVPVTAAANASNVLLATVGAGTVVRVEGVIIKSTGVTTMDLSSVTIRAGAAKIFVFIDNTVGAKVNLDVADEQVAWIGSAELGAASTIYMDLTGGGVTPVAMLVTIYYRVVSGVNGLA